MSKRIEELRRLCEHSADRLRSTRSAYQERPPLIASAYAEAILRMIAVYLSEDEPGDPETQAPV